MKSVPPRLWKQIGNQTHKKPSQAMPQSNMEEERENFKIDTNQQFTLPIDESIIKEKKDISELREMQNDMMNELVSFMRPRKQSMGSDFLEAILQNLPDVEEKTTDILKNASNLRTSPKYSTKLKIKMLFQLLHNEVSQLRRQIDQIKIYIVMQTNQIEKFVRALFTELENIASHSVELLSKKYAEKKLESEEYKKKLEQKDDIQKALGQQIRKKEIELIAQKIETQKLMRQIQIMNSESHRQLRQNSQLSEKVFDLQQKILSFDLKVQEQVQVILAEMCNNSEQQKEHNKLQIEIQDQEVDKKIFQKSISKPNISSVQYITSPLKHYQSQFSSPRRRESYGPGEYFEVDEEVRKKTNQHHNPMRPLQKFFSKTLYESQPMTLMKGNASNNSSSDFKKHFNNTERVKTVHSRELTTPNNFKEGKKWSFEAGSRTSHISNISQKLNRIKVEIQKQINNVSIYNRQ